MKLVLEHVAVAARDPVALKEWYVRVLRAKVACSNEQTPPVFLLTLEGSAMIEIYPGDHSLAETGDKKLNGWRHIALRVESLASAKAELEGRGVKFAEGIDSASGGGTVIFFQDPEGNLLHLVERPTHWPVQ